MIHYQKMEINPELINSIKNRGISLAIKVKCVEDGYEVIDGHKRCNACEMLGIEEIPCVLTNDFSKAGSAYWGNTKNHH